MSVYPDGSAARHAAIGADTVWPRGMLRSLQSPEREAGPGPALHYAPRVQMSVGIREGIGSTQTRSWERS